MLDLGAYAWTGAALLGAAVAAWIVSLLKRDVSIVDSLWSMMFLLIACQYALQAETLGPRAMPILALTAIWALRLSVHIGLRNRGKPEDPRYQAIRANNEPGFALKSLYIVFGLQALLAWIIAAPLVAAVSGTSPLNVLDYLGIALWVLGFAFESIGDHQLARFKIDPANDGKVLDTGLWAYSRHPNYFGECVLWWGFYLLALGAGAWWTLFAPLIMTFLLLKVSGVALLEKDIHERRPGYADYVRSTNAFVPGPRRSPNNSEIPI